MDSEGAGLRKLTLQVYQSVLEEYEWSNHLSTLKARHCYLDPPADFVEPEPVEPAHEPLASATDQNDFLFNVTESKVDGSTDQYLLNGRSIIVEQAFHPHPPYESCAPISRSLMVGDDPDHLPFIPFSDDPAYNFQSDIEEHTFVRWHPPCLDPDLEVVACQTVERLIENHGATPEDIDRAAVLPLPCMTLISLRKKRDFPKGPSSKTITSKYSASPEKIMDYFLSTFCSNLNCITGFCTTHLETQTPSFNPPKVPYHKLGDAIAHPCGMHCFLQPAIHSTSITSVTIWTAEHVQLLFSILNYAPDASSCDLAKLCRKPCREVHAKRADYQSPVKQVEKGKSVNGSAHRNYEESTKVFTPLLPCKHDGPCAAQSECSCFLNKAHCHTRCGCGKTCPRRWKGCTCATSKTGNVCGTKKCSCFRANFECDPEVCLTCEAKNNRSTLCRNVGIQRSILKQTEVRETTWGLGLFILEPCKKGELIAEYVGELIYEPTLKSRDVAASHRKRSYVFVLNPTFSVDGFSAGNPTRYMNHSPKPNCNTAVCLVNGEHRIGVYAARRIREGEELFIDYGPMFFKDKGSVSIGSEGPFSVPPKIDHSSDSTYAESQDEFPHG